MSVAWIPHRFFDHLKVLRPAEIKIPASIKVVGLLVAKSGMDERMMRGGEAVFFVMVYWCSINTGEGAAAYPWASALCYARY